MRRAFHTLDVFTDTPLAGNPLAVVLDSQGLDDARMQSIAREFNLAETVFVSEPKNPVNTAAVRIFTPARELPFAGHPTVGTAVLLAHLRAPELLKSEDLRIVLEEKVGDVVCVARHRKGQAKAAYFTVPRTPERMSEPPSMASLAADLGLEVEDIGFDAHEPVVMGAGTANLFVPLKSLAVDGQGAAGPQALGRERRSLPLSLYPRERSRGIGLPCPHVRGGLGRLRGPGDGERRRRLRGRDDGVRKASRRRACRDDRAGRRDGAAELHLGRPRRGGRRIAQRDDRRLGGDRLRGEDRSLSGSRILEVAELDFRLAPYDWPFAVERAREIRSHWEERSKAQPKLFNGRVLLLGRHAFESRADGGLVLRGAYFETDFAAFLAWRDFGFPDASVCNGFSMAALQGSDGVFLLGEMSSHTANAGLIYFAAGTPDRQDVFGERVDLGASVTRELEEETGICRDRDDL